VSAHIEARGGRSRSDGRAARVALELQPVNRRVGRLEGCIARHRGAIVRSQRRAIMAAVLLEKDASECGLDMRSLDVFLRGWGPPALFTRLRPAN
jgi:hypothetical protein